MNFDLKTSSRERLVPCICELWYGRGIFLHNHKFLVTKLCPVTLRNHCFLIASRPTREIEPCSRFRTDCEACNHEMKTY